MRVLTVKNSDQARWLGKRFSTALALAITLVASTAVSDDFEHRRQYLLDMLSDPGDFPVRRDCRREIEHERYGCFRRGGRMGHPARMARPGVYGVKGEYNQPIIWVRDCDHIRVFGYGGNAAAVEGRALFVIERTPNVVLANLVDSPRMPQGIPDTHFACDGVDPADGIWFWSAVPTANRY